MGCRPLCYYAQDSAKFCVYLILSFLTFVQFCLLGNWQVLAAQFIIEFHCLLSGINFYIHFFPRDGGTWGAGGVITPSIFDRIGSLLKLLSQMTLNSSVPTGLNNTGLPSVMGARSRLILVYVEEDDQLTCRGAVEQLYLIQE